MKGRFSSSQTMVVLNLARAPPAPVSVGGHWSESHFSLPVSHHDCLCLHVLHSFLVGTCRRILVSSSGLVSVITAVLVVVVVFKHCLSDVVRVHFPTFVLPVFCHFFSHSLVSLPRSFHMIDSKRQTCVWCVYTCLSAVVFLGIETFVP